MPDWYILSAILNTAFLVRKAGSVSVDSRWVRTPKCGCHGLGSGRSGVGSGRLRSVMTSFGFHLGATQTCWKRAPTNLLKMFWA